mgnify:CR=1 FL=1
MNGAVGCRAWKPAVIKVLSAVRWGDGRDDAGGGSVDIPTNHSMRDRPADIGTRRGLCHETRWGVCFWVLLRVPAGKIMVPFLCYEPRGARPS